MLSEFGRIGRDELKRILDDRDLDLDRYKVDF